MTAIQATTMTTNAGPVTEGHRFDVAGLEAYMAAHVDGFRGPVALGQYQGGMSNPTFVVEDAGGRRYVLRKKPPGKLLPSAHAIEREFRVITALQDTDVPVARAYALCEDEAVIGQAFYLMEFVEGRVFRDCSLPELAPDERRAVYDQMNDTLARLHKVDFDAVGLGDFGRAGGYIGRQVRRWAGQYEATKTDDLPAMEKLMAWLPGNIPDDSETTIAHGDFRLENMIFHPTRPEVLAVVDWELCTLGNPLSDLAYNCLPYYMRDPHRGHLIDIDYDSYGIPSVEDYVVSYCRRAGRAPIDNWEFYVVLSLFRLAAIVQGVYYRGLQGNASSTEAVKRRDQCRNLSTTAWELVEKSGRA